MGAWPLSNVASTMPHLCLVVVVGHGTFVYAFPSMYVCRICLLYKRSFFYRKFLKLDLDKSRNYFFIHTQKCILWYMHEYMDGRRMYICTESIPFVRLWPWWKKARGKVNDTHQSLEKKPGNCHLSIWIAVDLAGACDVCVCVHLHFQPCHMVHERSHIDHIDPLHHKTVMLLEKGGLHFFVVCWIHLLWDFFVERRKYEDWYVTRNDIKRGIRLA